MLIIELVRLQMNLDKKKKNAIWKFSSKMLEKIKYFKIIKKHLKKNLSEQKEIKKYSNG